jgi:hypothetical protein
MVAERLSSSEDPKPNSGWDSLAAPLPTKTEKSESKKKSSKHKAEKSDVAVSPDQGITETTKARETGDDPRESTSLLSLGDEVIWDRSGEDDSDDAREDDHDDAELDVHWAEYDDEDAEQTEHSPDPEQPVSTHLEQARRMVSAVHEQPQPLYVEEMPQPISRTEAHAYQDVPPVPPPFIPMLEHAPSTSVAPEAPTAFVTPQEAIDMQRQLADEAYALLEQPVGRAIEAPAPMPTPVGRYESNTPPGYQRTTEDVTRGAWTGVAAGWWLGRRGKRKAIKQAHQSGFEAGVSEVRHKLDDLRYQFDAQQRELQFTPAMETAGMSMGMPTPLSAQRERPVSVEIFERARQQKEHDEPPKAPVPHAVKVAAGVAIEKAVRQKERPEAMPAPEAAKAEYRLGKAELMRVAKDVKVDGIRLKDVFEVGRIDEEGLRAVVAVYLRGGDVRKQLTKELVVKERSYERDPSLRHMRAQEAKEDKTGSASSRETVGLLQGLGLAPSRTSTSTQSALQDRAGQFTATAQQAAKIAGDAVSRGAKVVQRDLIDNSNTSDWIGITAVVVLWSVILVLLFG